MSFLRVAFCGFQSKLTGVHQPAQFFFQRYMGSHDNRSGVSSSDPHAIRTKVWKEFHGSSFHPEKLSDYHFLTTEAGFLFGPTVPTTRYKNLCRMVAKSINAGVSFELTRQNTRELVESLPTTCLTPQKGEPYEGIPHECPDKASDHYS